MAQWNRRIGASHTRIGAGCSLPSTSASPRSIRQLDAPPRSRHATRMLTHLASTSAETLAHWHTFRDPLIGLVTALVLALVGRFMRIELLATAAGGAGIIAGWYAITGSLWMTSRPASVDDLPAIAIAALIIGLAATRLGSGSGAIGGGLVAGVLAGWFLSGASRTLAQFRSEWPLALGIALAIVVFVRALTSSAPQPLRLALAGLTMAASFHVVAMPFVWTELALGSRRCLPLHSSRHPCAAHGRGSADRRGYWCPGLPGGARIRPAASAQHRPSRYRSTVTAAGAMACPAH